MGAKFEQRIWFYDAVGNRTNSGYVTGAANETTSDGTWTYTYDAAGQRVKKSKGASAETWTYSYDHDGHLTRVEQRTTDGGTLQLRVDYSYDAFGNRLTRKQYDGSLTLVSEERYAYDGWKTNLDALGSRANFLGQENWDVWGDLDGSNALKYRRMYGNEVDQPLARIDPSVTAVTGAQWYITDRQGSVNYLIGNGSGGINATITYDGFGNIKSQTYYSPIPADRYKYTGRELDEISGGLLNLRDRVMAQDLGKFLTRDRVGFAAGDTNLTRYVGNNFTNASDPSGNWVFAKDAQVGYAWSDWFATNNVTSDVLTLPSGKSLLWIPESEKKKVIDLMRPGSSEAYIGIWSDAPWSTSRHFLLESASSWTATEFKYSAYYQYFQSFKLLLLEVLRVFPDRGL